MFAIEIEIVHGENKAYEVTKCFSADGWSVAVACIEKMTTGIYALVIRDVGVER